MFQVQPQGLAAAGTAWSALDDGDAAAALQVWYDVTTTAAHDLSSIEEGEA